MTLIADSYPRNSYPLNLYHWLGPYTVKRKHKKEWFSSLRKFWRFYFEEKYNAALLKPYIENASGQKADEKDVAADERGAKKNFDNVLDE